MALHLHAHELSLHNAQSRVHSKNSSWHQGGSILVRFLPYARQLRRHISARLGISAKESREVHGASTTTKSIARGGSSQENLDESKGADADKDLKGSGIIDVDTAKDGVTRSRVGDRGVQPADGAGFSDVDDELHGVELLEACDRLEHDNLMLRQRLAKRELEVLQGEHEQEDDAKISDASLAQVHHDTA